MEKVSFEKINGEFVKTEQIDFSAAVQLMDLEIAEDLNQTLAPCSNQEFFDAYCKAHKAKFGCEFAL